MTEAEFRKKTEAIKERYSKFAFYFNKKHKKNFGLSLSNDCAAVSSLFDDSVFLFVSDIKLHIPKVQEAGFFIKLYKPKLNAQHKIYFSSVYNNLAYDSIERIFERIDDELLALSEIKKNLLKTKVDQL